jgi:hypothetical protein
MGAVRRQMMDKKLRAGLAKAAAADISQQMGLGGLFS